MILHGARRAGPGAVRPVRRGLGQHHHAERARGAPAGDREQDHGAARGARLVSLVCACARILSHVGVALQTAQVASQQGKYLGRKLTKLAKQRDVLIQNGLAFGPGADEAVSGAFKYLHLGSLAYACMIASSHLVLMCVVCSAPRLVFRYIGNAAVFDLGKTSFMGGLAAMYAWRSVYWSEQVSSRTRALLMIDWIVRCVVANSLFVSAGSYPCWLASQRCLGQRPLTAVELPVCISTAQPGIRSHIPVDFCTQENCCRQMSYYKCVEKLLHTRILYPQQQPSAVTFVLKKTKLAECKGDATDSYGAGICTRY